MKEHGPIATTIEDGALDCGESDLICDLGPLTGESRAAWLARLKSKLANVPEVHTKDTDMVAAQPLAPLPLLFEPDRIDAKLGESQPRYPGWRGRRGQLIRYHDDDAWGACVQRIVLRYMRDGVQRQTLAQEYGVSERQVQAYLSGEAWQSYTLPLRRALDRIGITYGRITNARRQAMYEHVRRLAPTICQLLEHDDRIEAKNIVESLRLLAGDEP